MKLSLKIKSRAEEKKGRRPKIDQNIIFFTNRALDSVKYIWVRNVAFLPHLLKKNICCYLLNILSKTGLGSRLKDIFSSNINSRKSWTILRQPPM